MTNSSVLLVSGPTGAGKSALAVKLAKELQGEVINVDSVQVYQGFDIGSAKLSAAEREEVPHHALDVLKPEERCNVAKFTAISDQALAKVRANGKLPIFAGGTTMYITALFHGLATMPAGDEAARAELEKLSNVELYSRLTFVDPVSAARLHPNDRMRVIRAIETSEISGKPASQIRASHGLSEERLRGLMLVLVDDRDKLYARLNKRAENMINDGLIEEVQNLQASWGDELPGLETIGYAETVRFLHGHLSQEQLVEEIAMNTRRLAKRQLTFWANEPRKRGWATLPAEGESSAVEIRGESEMPTAKLKSFYAFSYTEAELLTRVRERMGQPFERNEVWFVAVAEL